MLCNTQSWANAPLETLCNTCDRSPLATVCNASEVDLPHGKRCATFTLRDAAVDAARTVGSAVERDSRPLETLFGV